MDLRVEIFMLKLVYNENVTLFGRSECDLWGFEDFVFPAHILEFSLYFHCSCADSEMKK
jgi:hypothetical protein